MKVVVISTHNRGDSNEYHNIGFYEEISKIIIKYAPYLFSCYMME